MFLWIKKVIVPCHQATTAKFIRTFLVNDFNFRKLTVVKHSCYQRSEANEASIVIL